MSGNYNDDDRLIDEDNDGINNLGDFQSSGVFEVDNNDPGSNIFPFLTSRTARSRQLIRFLLNPRNNGSNQSLQHSLNSYYSLGRNTQVTNFPTALNNFDLPDHRRVDFGRLGNIEMLPAILNPDSTSIATSSDSFFKKHPQHEFVNSIPISMQKYGLETLMNNLLVDRNNERENLNSFYQSPKRKRTFNDVCIEDFKFPGFLADDNIDDLKFQNLEPSSFLKSGSVFMLPVSIAGLTPNVKFTDVNYENLNVSGYLQLGSVQLGFSGELVDFLSNDLRYMKGKNCLLEGNIFSNLLRNKLVQSGEFDKLFDEQRKKCYTKSNWKPFSMDNLGYLRNNNFTDFLESSLSSSKHELWKIKPNKPAKFPNGSVFHKMQLTNDPKCDNYKFLSKWFDMTPLNQYIHTPSPPTPPRGPMKCINNPENLLICKDCVNLIMSKYLFLQIEIDINELLEEDSTLEDKALKVYPDLIYKHRRRFSDYTARYMQAQPRRRSNFPVSIRYSSFLNLRPRNILSVQSDDRIRGGSERSRSFESSNGYQLLDIDSSNPIPENEDDDHHRNYHGTEANFDNESDESDESECTDIEDELPTSLDFNVHNTRFRNNKNCSPSSQSESDFSDFSDTTSLEPNTSTDGLNTEPSFTALDRSLPSVWPLSAERHPILDPEISSNEADNSDDEQDTPFHTIVNNIRSRRLTRLLYHIDLSREQHRHRNEPVSTAKLYGNSNHTSINKRMKMVMLLSINRSTGELNMVPGNMDVNMWSVEQNDGELFEDIETFNSVCGLFINSKESEPTDTKYTRKIKRWLNKGRSLQLEQVKKLLFLQILANPSIINQYLAKDKKRYDKTISKKVKAQYKKHVSSKKKKRNVGVTDDNRTASKSPTSNEMSEEIKDNFFTIMGENSKYKGSNEKVLTFIPGLKPRSSSSIAGLSSNKNYTSGYDCEMIQDSLYSFEYS